MMNYILNPQSFAQIYIIISLLSLLIAVWKNDNGDNITPTFIAFQLISNIMFFIFNVSQSNYTLIYINCVTLIVLLLIAHIKYKHESRLTLQAYNQTVLSGIAVDIESMIQ